MHSTLTFRCHSSHRIFQISAEQIFFAITTTNFGLRITHLAEVLTAPVRHLLEWIELFEREAAVRSLS